MATGGRGAGAARRGADIDFTVKAKVLGGLLVVMWVLEIVDAVLGGSLDQFGIRPRSTDGLVGLAASPFLHGGFEHLVSNTIPFAVLGFLTMVHGVGTFWRVSLFAALVGGLLVWLVGASNSVHIGASGVIFGYFGFLLAMGFFERSAKAILIAVLVGLGYGGLIFGVLPSQPGVSWEGHLFGFLAGGTSAWMLASAARRRAGTSR
jgi:membrane associated rhomboid family serine protease